MNFGRDTPPGSDVSYSAAMIAAHAAFRMGDASAAARALFLTHKRPVTMQVHLLYAAVLTHPARLRYVPAVLAAFEGVATPEKAYAVAVSVCKTLLSAPFVCSWPAPAFLLRDALWRLHDKVEEALAEAAPAMPPAIASEAQACAAMRALVQVYLSTASKENFVRRDKALDILMTQMPLPEALRPGARALFNHFVSGKAVSWTRKTVCGLGAVFVAAAFLHNTAGASVLPTLPQECVDAWKGAARNHSLVEALLAQARDQATAEAVVAKTFCVVATLRDPLCAAARDVRADFPRLAADGYVTAKKPVSLNTVVSAIKKRLAQSRSVQALASPGGKKRECGASGDGGKRRRLYGEGAGAGARAGAGAGTCSLACQEAPVDWNAVLPARDGGLGVARGKPDAPPAGHLLCESPNVYATTRTAYRTTLSYCLGSLEEAKRVTSALNALCGLGLDGGCAYALHPLPDSAFHTHCMAVLPPAAAGYCPTIDPRPPHLLLPTSVGLSRLGELSAVPETLAAQACAVALYFAVARLPARFFVDVNASCLVSLPGLGLPALSSPTSLSGAVAEVFNLPTAFVEKHLLPHFSIVGARSWPTVFFTSAEQGRLSALLQDHTDRSCSDLGLSSATV